jgi:hypothetical protein
VNANGSCGETESRDSALPDPGSDGCPPPDAVRPGAAPYAFAWRAPEEPARGADVPANGGLPVSGEPPICCSAESR